MKNILLRVVVQVITIIVFTSGSLTVFGKTTDVSEKYVKAEKEVSVKQEKKEEVKDLEKIVDDQVVEDISSNEVVSNDNNYNYGDTTPAVTGNRIVIGSVLNNTLMNDDGSYFYLDHNINGVYDGRGVPFIDYRTNFNTKKTIIYAHSSTIGNGPFQVLQNYHNNPGFYYSNPFIEINYNGVYYKYQIFSVYVSVADNDYSEGLEYFQNIDYDDATWQERLNYYKSKSEYDTGVSVGSSDKIIILQTCSMDPNYYEKYYRYNLLIMGKLI